MIIDGSFIFVGLVTLASLLTIVLLISRTVLFGIGAGVSWLVLGILFVTGQLVREVSSSSISEVSGNVTATVTTLTTSPILEGNLNSLLSYLFISMAFGCLIYYLTGLGKTKVTMTDGKKTWNMWDKPPKELTRTRAQLVRDNYKARLGSLRSRHK